MHTESHSARRCSRGSSLRVKALAFFTLLLVIPNLVAQSSAISGVMAPMALYINIVEGEDALNNIHDRTAREPIVQVTDENHKPVKGAVVTFSDVAGATGAAGSFGGLLTYTTVTDADGKAIGRGFRPNSIVGDHRVQVSAAVGMMMALMIIIHEKNVGEGLPPVKFTGGLGAVLATQTGAALTAIGAAVTGVALYVGLHSDSPSTPALSSSTPAAPASVPEIDPSLAFACLVLLAGAVVVLRGR